MPGINQLIRKPRQGPSKKKGKKTNALDGDPQKRGVVIRPLVRSPKKPNSAARKVAKVRLSNGKIITASIPGEGHNLKEHGVVYVKGKKTPDTSGKYGIVRGRGDASGVEKRKQGRSHYGTKKDKK